MVKKAEQYQSVFYAMERHLLGKNLGPFPGLFHLVAIDNGTMIVMANPEDEAIVMPVSMEWVERAVTRFIADLALNLEGYNDWTPKNIAECAKYWKLRTEIKPEPKPFLWPREQGMAFQRLPWEKTLGPTPLWDKLTSKLSNVEAFRHFIGSLFEADSDRQQYLVIYGEGKDGKGSINRVLAKVFGSAYYSGDPPSTSDKFWTYYSVIGKRLMVFPDCDYSRFMKTSLFKRLTGDDPIACEQKNGPIINYQPKAKFLIFANVRPEISSSTADMRRIIYCEFDPKGEFINSPNFDAALWGEAGFFLTRCIHEFAEKYPSANGRRPEIKVDQTAHAPLLAHVSVLEEDFEEVFESEFQYDKTLRSYVLPSRLQEILQARFQSDRRRKLEFVAWMERKYGVRKKSYRDGEQVKHAYFGVVVHRDIKGQKAVLSPHLRPVDS